MPRTSRPRSTILPPELATAPGASQIVVYWRPGCPFCRRLRSQLRRHLVEHRLVNIWEDRAAAQFVRSVANGNETVPTVTVAGVPLVNPSVQDVLALTGTGTPASTSPAFGQPVPRRFARWFSRSGTRSRSASARTEQ